MSFKKFDGSTWQTINPKKLKGIPYTGALPATLTGTKAGYLHRYKVYGNTEQTGTPTPENPIMPIGCGERTTNLFDLFSYFEVSASISDIIIEKNSITYNALAQYLAIKYKFNLGITDVYTISLGGDSVNTRLELRYLKNGEFVGRATLVNPNQKITVRGGNEYDEFYVFISNGTNTGTCTASNIMLNSGSTALPYEPYGYKLPILSNGTTTDIYLGEVETTRKVKKLVLTGNEVVAGSIVTGGWIVTNLPISTVNTAGVITAMCSHYKAVNNSPMIALTTNNMCISTNSTNRLNFATDILTANDFKSYLQQQYAAGTPVTVWYVLAEPETEVVNEPLMKIGDYADTIDSTQTSVQIPTAAGETTISWAGEGLAPSEFDSIQEWVDIPTYTYTNGAWVEDN